MNTLTIRAERKALPKGQPCNSKNRLVGVVASLKLRFRPDLVAVPSPIGPEQSVRAAAGEAKGALGTITFRNAGPSGSPGGKFVFSWSASGEVETAFAPSSLLSGGTLFRNCEGHGLMSGTIECEYTDFPAGKVAALPVITPVRAGPKFGPSSVGDVAMTWQILPAGGDVNGGNNAASHKIILCGASATDSRCKK